MSRLTFASLAAAFALAPSAAVVAVAPARFPAPSPCPPGFERGAPHGRGNCEGIGAMRGLMLSGGAVLMNSGEMPLDPLRATDASMLQPVWRR